ncbi:hypothetical protein [Saccharicrinis sp. FJH54]|uniref:hypothetical protein n=1 Tax=Saccharicrinis sp. FJH54 TaxID=3344665 RepID=UPI0035D420B9
MKNKLIYGLLLLLFAFMYSCKEEQIEDAEYSPEREFMTMFRNDNNTGKGDSDPYRCQVVDVNDVHLYWYGVIGSAGYEIKMALQPNVSSGLAADWENPAYILLDTIVGPEVLDIIIKDLQYSTDYRFAIRTLSAKGEGYHSKWYGYGSGRQWAEYQGLATQERYSIPEVIVVDNITKTSLRVNIDRSLATSGDDGTFTTHFEIDDNGNFIMQILTVEASATNPDATVPDEWKRYVITTEDFETGYIDIDGLQENSVYVINVENINIPVHWDAIYNTCVIRMDGEPGEPILIPHYVDPNDTIEGAVEYNACRIDTIIDNYTADASLAEGTIFYLEGGKTYYLYNNTSLCKGMTLATKPEDLAAGKRAKVLLSGMSLAPSGIANQMNFMFGRRPQSGELGGINIKSLIFEGIDFDCPLAKNYGDGSSNGNYFINMYSDGMAVTLQSFEVRNCTFQRMVRGFIRVQGVNRKTFEHLIVEDCIVYNCGFYDNNGRGYAWVAGDGSNAKSNIFMDMVFRNNTFYDSPRTCFFTDGGKNLDWSGNIQYKITFENNTLVNFSTRSSGRKLFDLRYLPSGSSITVKKNLFIQTKKDEDTRNMYFEGMDIRFINGAAQEITFDIADNYSSSSDETQQVDDGIFTSAAFSANKNSAGAYSLYSPGIIQGEDQLVVKVGTVPISPSELMKSPNPPIVADDPDMHEIDNLNGLFYNNTATVHNHEIYTLGIGDPRWRQ